MTISADDPPDCLDELRSTATGFPWTGAAYCECPPGPCLFPIEHAWAFE